MGSDMRKIPYQFVETLEVFPRILALIFTVVLGTFLCSSSMAGITDIDAFLEMCPTDDPIFEQLTIDFALMKNGVWIDPTELTCTSPVSKLPIEEWTDELIFYQTIRTMYYMDFGQAEHLPWTSLSLYDWMRKLVNGARIEDGVIGGSCCSRIDGRNVFLFGSADEFNRDFDRSWRGILGNLSFYAHERRHSDPDAPGHTSTVCCEGPACDQEYNEANLGAYGVSFWLHKQWATRQIDLGGCGDIVGRLSTQASDSNLVFRTRFCTNIPVPTVIDINGPECGAGTFEDRRGLTGMWYDPALDGEGFNFIVDGSRWVVIYYGYSASGERLWLISGVYYDEIQAGKTVVLNMYEYLGGTFDSPKPGTDAILPWGSVTIQFDNCSAGKIQMFGVDGEKMSEIVPLITAGVTCENIELTE